MWLLTHVGVPLSVGMMIGVFVRSFLKAGAIMLVLAIVAFAIFSKMGITEVNEEQAEQATTLWPTVKQMTAGLWATLKTSPAAVVGLATGVVLKERWRHRGKKETG